MKLITPLLVLTLAVSASAQTVSTPAPKKTATSAASAKSATAAKPAATAHAGATAAHATAAHPAAGAETLPANIPVVKGVAKPLYALRYIDISVGTGPLAEPSVLGTTRENSKIMFYTVHYTGWLAKDGTKFDSSVDRGSPITFPYGVHQVIPGWDTGFEGMHIGGKRRIFVPYQLAYGEQGRPPVIPAKADLIFDVELVGVSDKQPTPPAPPADATKPAGAAPTAEKQQDAAKSAEKPATPTPPATAPAAAKPAVPAKPESK